MKSSTICSQTNLIPDVNMSGTNSRAQIFCHEDCTNIVTPHNDWNFDLNKQASQESRRWKVFLSLLPIIVTYSGSLLENVTPFWAFDLQQIGTPSKIHDKTSYTDCWFRISFPITITIWDQVPLFTFMLWLQRQTIQFGIQDKLDDYLHLPVSCKTWTIHTFWQFPYDIIQMPVSNICLSTIACWFLIYTLIASRSQSCPHHRVSQS